MPQSEFDIIAHYFKNQQVKRDDVTVGIGDDAAIISIPADRQLIVALDTLVAGVHFPDNTQAEDIGYKALAVNLSDLAAMGAAPAWFTLALTLPSADKDWLDGFARGLFELAAEHGLELIGGDTTQGPLTISIQVAGYVPTGRALLRSGARTGDAIYVTGNLGDAALGLRCLQQAGSFPYNDMAVYRLNRPQARLAFGQALRGLASACIDISDGLLADLGHILTASNVGARIDRQALPLSVSLQTMCQQDEKNYALALAGGDDYELCFCVSPQHDAALQSAIQQSGLRVTQIGTIEPQAGIRLHHAGQACNMEIQHGYEHFAG